MKVQIDRDDCISCTACWQECPEVFEEHADGFSAVLQRLMTFALITWSWRISDDMSPRRYSSCWINLTIFRAICGMGFTLQIASSISSGLGFLILGFPSVP